MIATILIVPTLSKMEGDYSILSNLVYTNDLILLEFRQIA